jgi:RNA-directed DNA polymerase
MKPKGGDGHPSTQDKPELRSRLLERILSRENMLLAWKRVKANKGAAGIDKMTVEQFPEYVRHHWDEVRLSLLKGTYTPEAVRRVEIPKPAGGKRPLGIPTVLDRVIQQATAQVLGPLFEPVFSQNSYGFRPRRSGHQAVRAVQKAVQEGYTIAVDTDLSKFFDTVNHDVLMRLLSVRVRDQRVMRLIARYLHAGVSIDGHVQPTTQGVPQGGPLSPLLANVVLNELDKELEQRGHCFARYADDFIILVKSKSAGQRVYVSIRRFIERRLHLRVNETKSKVAPIGECRFLGFRIHRKRIRWDPDVEREFKRRIRELTSRKWGISMEVRLHKLREYMHGWTNYFGISEYYTPIPKLDQWIRRRIRLCYWKMWKKPRKRMSELMKLGTSRKEAILAGRSRKGLWVLSRTLATQTGMTDAWLASQGFLSIKEQWVAIHYPSQG